jgi:tripartite-type tricarboxylate transporter receptor subunit TctC
MKRTATLLMFALMASTFPLSCAMAQDDPASGYPNKAIKIVVPYPPGGSTDALARLMSTRLQQRLGQTVIVENKPGGGSNIGALYVAKSPADGYTLFLGTSAALATNQHLFKSLPYDPQKDFAPVILATILPSLVVVNNAMPVKTMKELNQYLLSHPDQVNYASSGNGTPAHLGAEMYKKSMGIKMTHVPYKGGAPALTDLVGGQTSLMFGILPEVMPFVKDGKLRALAVTTAKRSQLAPELPTVAEAGVANYELVAWYAFTAPAGTPKSIVAKLNKEFNAALEDKETRDKLIGMGFEIAGGPPERLADLMRSESNKWKQVVLDANVKVD